MQPAQNELLDRICRLQDDRETGVLVLEKEDREIRIYFQEGLIAATSSNIAFLHLGHFLCARGYTSNAEIAALLRKSRRRRKPLGKIAVERNLLHEAELEEVVREQVVQSLTHALDNGFDVGSFLASEAPVFASSQLDIPRLLLDLARGNLRPLRLQPSQRIALRNGHAFAGLPWYPQELSVLSELKEPRTIQELAAITGLDFEHLSRILSVFESLRLITLPKDLGSEITALVKREKFPFESLAPEISPAHVSEKLEAFREESPFISEQFKTMKVRIAEAAASRPLHAIVVSSPQAADGKSLISVNLAATFSKDLGRKVVIVDGDLRNPSLHRFLGTTAEPGLLGYLESDYLQPYCFLRRCDRLYVMTAGGVAANPVELLGHQRMTRLMDALKADFDTIIIDAPPLAPIADTQVLTGLADGVVLVVRCGKTTYDGLEEAFRIIDRNKLVGVVLNDVQPMIFNTHYDYKYYNYKKRGAYPYATQKSKGRSKTYIDS